MQIGQSFITEFGSVFDTILFDRFIGVLFISSIKIKSFIKLLHKGKNAFCNITNGGK